MRKVRKKKPVVARRVMSDWWCCYSVYEVIIVPELQRIRYKVTKYMLNQNTISGNCRNMFADVWLF